MPTRTQIAFDFGEPPEEKKPVVQDEVTTTIGEETIAEQVIIEEETIGEETLPVETIEEEVITTTSATVPVLVKTKSTRGRKSLKEMDASAGLIEVPDDEILFQKKYYTIGKVAEMFKVNQSLIRLWENEFDILKPKKNGKGDRLFRPEDIKNLQLIHHLTREKKYTMEGAKNFLRNNKKADEKFAMIESLKRLRSFLHELKANL